MDEIKKMNIKVVGGIILSILAILIFVSKTIYTYNLPIVTGVMPKNGKLNKTEKAKGLADWAEVSVLYAEIGGKVEEVYAKQGEPVQEGQKLFSLSFNEEELQKTLQELEVSRNKTATDIKSAQLKIDNSNRYISQLKNETYESDSISDYDIRKLDNEIKNAEEDLEKQKLLVEAGGLPQSDYDKAKNNLTTLVEQKKNLENTLDENKTKQNKELSDKETDREKKLKDYASEIEAYKNQITLLNLDLQNNSIARKACEDRLAKLSENKIIYATGTGKLTEFNVNKGQQIGDGFLAARIGCGNQYEIQCDLSLDNNFVVIGDTCKMKNANNSLEGTVSNIVLSEQSKKVTISVESEKISSGETFDITFEKQSTQNYTLVPTGAINMDSDGYFVYQLKRRDGMLGKEYYAQKLRVYIGDNDDTNTAITEGGFFFEPVVQTSKKEFSEGQSLNLSNAGDFFEK